MAILRRENPDGSSYGYNTGNKDLYYYNAAGTLVNTAPYGSGVFYDVAYSRVKPVLGAAIRSSKKPSADLLQYAPRLTFSRAGQPVNTVVTPDAATLQLGQIEF